MTDEEFEKEVEELTAMLRLLRDIRDKNRTKWLKDELRLQFLRLLKNS